MTKGNNNNSPEKNKGNTPIVKPKKYSLEWEEKTWDDAVLRGLGRAVQNKKSQKKSKKGSLEWEEKIWEDAAYQAALKLEQTREKRQLRQPKK